MTRIAGLIGDPVDHSLSPVMHSAAMQAMGIDARYELWPTPEADLDVTVGRVRREGVIGANVTVPHKQAVMPFLDEVTDAARMIGAVNTIIPRDGRLIGDNTDAYGWTQSVREAYPSASMQSALILGAGGASRAILAGLSDLGVEAVLVANRTLARAESVAAAFERDAIALDQLKPTNLEAVDLLVNATSAGWHDELPIEPTLLAALPHHAIVCDLTYRQTPLLRYAQTMRLRTLDGLGMLVHQGARSLELWTRQSVPVDVMRQALIAEQKRREEHPNNG